jgi:muramoyltetrapeptide carboxypeptidase
MTAANSVLKPKRLAPGQTIGVIAPSSPASEDDQIHAALEMLESLGFRVKTGAHLYRRYGYLAGSDAERAADLNDMFADPNVDAIVAFRGGYGASRLLPYLDYELIRRNPKLLMGYSDITALLNGIHAKTGLVTFHGPIADGNFTPYTLAEFKKVLLNPQPPMAIGVPPASEVGEGVVERKNRLVRIAPGTARGPLIGGNLTLMAHLTGTPYQPDFRGKILFLEDVHEAIYALDRYLTQLWLAGLLQQVAGIVLGKFTDCTPNYGGGWSLTLEQALADRCLPLGIPVLRGLMIGHIDEQTIVPVGCEAALDVEAGTLTLLEMPVM